MRKIILDIALILPIAILFLLAQPSDVKASTVFDSTYQTNNIQVLPPIPKESGIEANAEIYPTYPGTNVTMRPGDVLHSPKSTSTNFVGHVAIVGPDLKLRHSHPQGPGRSETLESYLTWFAPGDKFTILRPRNGGGAAAATWSVNNINKLTSYYLPAQLHVIPLNYCSKFVWQAYYYGEQKDLVGDARYSPILTPIGLVSVYPSEILNSPIMVKQGIFYK